jgi:hypothetical protein
MPEEVWFSAMMMQKDLLPAAQANEFLTAAKAMGYGDQDFAVLFKVLARLAGRSEV